MTEAKPVHVPARRDPGPPPGGLTVSSRRRSLSRLETGAALVATVLYWTELLRIVFPGTDGASVEFRAIHFAFYGLFLSLIARDLPAARRVLLNAPLMVFLLGLPIVSALWSVSPSESIQRGIAVLGSSLFAVYLASQVAPREALRLVALGATIAAAISVVLIVALPSVGVMQDAPWAGTWSGAHMHKNAMGQMTALGTVLCLIVLMQSPRPLSPAIASGLALNALLLAGSRSLSAQLVCGACVLLLLGVGRFVRFVFDNALLLVLLIAPPLFYVLFTLSADDVFALLGAMGKDATMSSRVPLWQLLAEHMEGRWWLGYGYEAFWTEDNPAVRDIERKLYFRPYYSHNGYIELWIALGAVGFAIVTALLVRFAYMAAALLYRDDRNPVFLAAFTYILMFLLQNGSESTILQRNNMSWVFFVLLYLALAEAMAAPRATLSDARPRLPVA